MVPAAVDALFKLSKNIDIEGTKAAEIDQISRKYLKYEAQNLANPISELWNLSMTLKVHSCRFENLSVYSYSYKNTTPKISHS